MTRDQEFRHDIIRRGEVPYEEQIRAGVEPGNRGKFLALDVKTGDYEIDSSELAALDRLEARNPNALLYLLRIGHPGAYRIGGSTRAVHP